MNSNRKTERERNREHARNAYKRRRHSFIENSSKRRLQTKVSRNKRDSDFFVNCKKRYSAIVKFIFKKLVNSAIVNLSNLIKIKPLVQ